MDIKKLSDELDKLFKDKKYKEAIEKLYFTLDTVKHDKDLIYERTKVLSLIGSCYQKIAEDTEDEVEKEIFIQEAINNHKEQLELSKKIKDKEKRIYEKIEVNISLANNYKESQEQNSYSEAARYYSNTLKLILEFEKNDEKFLATFKHKIYYNLVYLYMMMAMANKNPNSTKEQYENAKINLSNFKTLTSQAEDGVRRQKALLSFLKNLYLEATPKNGYIFENRYNEYLSIKKEEIQNELPLKDIDNSLASSIVTVLAILNIPPIESKQIPLAHYTSSTVCNKLFNILSNENNEIPQMRIGSSTYMNDPSEGKGLLELLNIPEWKLENKTDCSTSNAFFTCFSSRVNDLNQFRLYGKEDGVEASGCCLVFNKKGNWLKEPNISSSFPGIIDPLDGEQIDPPIKNENLPLYQVAYIAHKDEYISDENFDIWLPDKNNLKFGIRLKLVGTNKNWQSFRIQELEKALHKLIKYFENKTTIKDDEKTALECIRYLFKDFAFRDEEEFRLLKIVHIDSEEIEYCEMTNSIYLPYADVRNMVDEVILGTNYEKTNSKRKIEVFQHLMKKECSNISVSLSSLPIYANSPIGKN
ncbi:sel1 repeat family protein [Haemophilus sp.]